MATTGIPIFGALLILLLTTLLPFCWNCPPSLHVPTVGDVYNKPPSQSFMTTPDLIKHYNYPVESYEVTTEDGYILNIFRIPYSNNITSDHKNVNREPVLVQHGLVCSSDDWFFVKPESSLPLMLADLGFDVWLGNCRGNLYSQKHVSLDVDDLEFWDFSFHEMGLYDMPAVINFVLEKTGKKELSYVGHSMGTTMFYIAMDKHRNLQTKIRKMISLSPVSYLSHVKTPMGVLAYVPDIVFMAWHELVARGRIFSESLTDFLKKYGPFVCSGDVPACFCENIIFFMTGYDYSQCTPETASMIVGHTPNDCSSKSLNHYLQWVTSDKFRAYDYGIIKNLIKYGQDQPPLYSLESNHVETMVMYSENDWLVQPPDAERAVRELGNVTSSMKVVMPEFTHLDFMYASDVKSQVNDYCVDFMLAGLKS